MRALAARDVIYAWEAGRSKHLVDRALLLLTLAELGIAQDSLSALSVGQRNTALLLLRQKTLGAPAKCLVVCPDCGERLEFTLDTGAMVPSTSEPLWEPDTRVHRLSVDGRMLSFRLPNSLDLASIVACPDADTARRLLLTRCIVVDADDDEPATAAEQISGRALDELADAMSECDPLAEVTLALDCPACQHSWKALFDIVTFFWTELEALAKRLLRDVHIIASAYGWHESEILALSAARRHYYLELIG
jgi:hypothetical protein